MGRMTLQRALILREMLEAPEAEWYGLELSTSAGLKTGTIYPALAALEQEGLLTSRWEEVDPGMVGRPRRRLYRFAGDALPSAHAYVAQYATALAPRSAKRRTGHRLPRERTA